MKVYLANRVSALRKQKGMTQKQLADKLRVSRQTIIAMEKGDYCPALILAFETATIFGKRVEEIFRVRNGVNNI